jgi:hypothetical protein
MTEKRERLVALILARRQSEARAAVNAARLSERLEPLADEDDPLASEEVKQALERDVARLSEATVDRLIKNYTPPGLVW